MSGGWLRRGIYWLAVGVICTLSVVYSGYTAGLWLAVFVALAAYALRGRIS